jgi:hypothetical protein
MTEPFFTAGDVCRMYHVLPWQLLQVLRRRLLAEPPRVAGRRVWRQADLPRVRAALVKAGYVREEAGVAHVAE